MWRYLMAMLLSPVATLALAGIVVLGSAVGQTGREGPSVPLPPALKAVPVPATNPARPARVELGRQLFLDPRLSRTGTVSCVTCHDPEKGYSNGERLATGVDGKQGTRNVPGLFNVGHAGSLFWDGRATTLEEQALQPIENPAEMDLKPAILAEKLNGIVPYREQFQAVFGGPATPERIALALAAFQRTLVANDTPFDRFLAGNRKALSEPAQRGMRLFFGEARCAVCHSGANLSDDRFHNIGTATAPDDLGRRAVTRKEADHGAFRTPQLREVGRTAPYMHDGRFKTLEAVVRHYNFGGVTDERNDHRDPELRVLYLSEAQVADLVAFLATGLTSRPRGLQSPAMEK